VLTTDYVHHLRFVGLEQRCHVASLSHSKGLQTKHAFVANTPLFNSKQETSADSALAELQSRLKDLELSKAHGDVSDILHNERAEMLISLRKIMVAMKSEAGSDGASSKEVEALRAENEELKKVNAKQGYRIQHLVHNLREAIDGKQ
jgi:hypothetical protein